MVEWKSPKTRKDVQWFLGFSNFYRKFIKNFAQLTAPITDCLSGKSSHNGLKRRKRDLRGLRRFLHPRSSYCMSTPTCRCGWRLMRLTGPLERY